MNAVELAAGSRLGPYDVLELVGRGGMGSVYKGYDRILNRYVALKVLPRDVLDDRSFAERFRREAQIWGRLDHPAIVPVYFADIEEEHPFLSMKFVGGGSLAELLKGGPMPLDRSTTVLAEVAAALDYAHAQGIVHRDVKPGNVLLGEGGRTYLSDFGIARVVAASASSHNTGVVGTPSYMAPEQARSQQADPRSDLYSLGCMAYEMLTGVAPFRGDTPIDVMMRHITDTATSPRALVPSLPGHVEAAIVKAMSKDPNERWPKAILFVQALLGEVHAHGVQTISLHAHPRLPDRHAAAMTLPPAPLPPRRSPLQRWAAVVVAVIGLGAAWGIWSSRRAPAPLEATRQTSAALLTSIERALDDGDYPRALEMVGVALAIDPNLTEARLLKDRILRAWEAEKSLGVWSPPSAAPAQGPVPPTPEPAGSR